ncbi:serine/threonine-protein phosphatase 6 regulatory ankyrin repeat subunit B-like [Apis mellifera carnica]|uniref:Serine/threonine-protein phosphatase 6 regulatory ankyrin repeat subunit B-like n=1 Tax=Apis mellifera TaxID=7460 RepID=A0A7M7GY54_APIME|nr:serine/threonine-protein phosphatase 6 regulatory ankyrin repeat subunit B-like [Apis mellifera]KAG9428332.1 serine/threonine-protein phosphatase 6 regulatory ankyrin repeat subunit B-like [Apis mellifera carnica]|eukprot:XP_006563536.2 serine/threonine-protein phosphatase 6 regulatory ankyrin repeat subunit B-like [Apis mellifera]
MSNTKFNYEKNDSIEEQFMWLLRFATVKKIKDFLTKIPTIDLHYPTPNLTTPITSAIDRGDPQILSFLLEKNSTNLDGTVTQPWGRTALMYASFVSRNPEILQILLKKGADPQKMDTRSWTCLQYAIVGERSKNVTFLLDAGVCINQRDAQGRTPLMISVYRSNLDILSILLDREADVNTRDDMGFTALQIAILCRKRDAAIMLIERGSDMSVVTPLTKASIGELCRTCMPKILRCLEPETSQE